MSDHGTVMPQGNPSTGFPPTPSARDLARCSHV